MKFKFKKTGLFERPVNYCFHERYWKIQMKYVVLILYQIYKEKKHDL